MTTRRILKKTPTPAERAYANIARVDERLTYETNSLLKQSGLSGSQYNVMRILRGAGGAGLACQKIRERLISRVPDITRLLDRLEASGYITRERGAGNDRRVVVTKITTSGLDTLANLDGPIEKLHQTQLSKLNDTEIDQLNQILTKLLDSRGR